MHDRGMECAAYRRVCRSEMDQSSSVLSDQCTILRHPGCNVAYWNLHERQIASGPGKSVSVRFEGAAFPLVFFHFSGYRPELPGMLSKYEDRFATPPPSVAPLAASYAASLLGHGYTTWSAHSYAYSAIPDGTGSAPPGVAPQRAR